MFGWSRGGGIPASLQQYTYDLYVDSKAAAGGDGSVFAPFDDIADAITAVNSAGNGTKLGVVRGSHFRKQLAFTSTLTGIQVRAVGEGERPIFDGSRIISAGAITPHASYANVYQVNVTHETETAPSGGANGSNTFHIALYEDETLLAEQFASGTIDTNVQSVRDNPGSYTAHKVGSTTADPRTDTGGTQYTYYFHLTDSGDPRSNGAVMAYTEQESVALFGNDHVWHGLEFRRSATKDMTGMANGAYAGGGSVTDCVFRDPGCHGGVLRPNRFVGNYAYGRQDGRSRLVGGGGINLYYDNTEGGYTTPIRLADNHVENFAIAYYSHGGVSGVTHESISGSNNYAEDCDALWNVALSLNGATVDGTTGINCVDGIYVYSAADVFTRVSYLSSETGDAAGILMHSDAEVSDSSFVFRSAGSNAAFQNQLAHINDVEDVFTLTLSHVSIKGGTGPRNARWRQVILDATDSVVGDMVNVATPIAGIVANNSYLSENESTVAEMVSSGATLTSSLSPWQMETMTVVPTADDIRFTDLTRTATEADYPSTVVTMNYTSVVEETAIRILNYDGAATPFDTYVKTRIDVNTSNGQVELEDGTPANFADKVIHEATYNKAFDFNTRIRNYSAARTDGGPSVEIDFGSGSYTAQQDEVLWRISGAVSPLTGTTYEAPNGSTIVTVDTDAGIIDQAFSVHIGDTLRVTACALRLDDDVVWAGDPDTTGVAILDPSSPLYALGMGRQTA